jgi:hypothetical protein
MVRRNARRMSTGHLCWVSRGPMKRLRRGEGPSRAMPRAAASSPKVINDLLRPCLSERYPEGGGGGREETR